MKVLSIDPNNGEYFLDKSVYVSETNLLYQGHYNYTPVFPRYTFDSLDRFNYLNTNNEIKFYTMLPIKRFFCNYLVEIRFNYIIDTLDKDSLNKAIYEFNNFCTDNKKTININALLKNGAIF